VQAGEVGAAGAVADVTVGADEVVGGVLAGGVQAEPAQRGAVGVVQGAGDGLAGEVVTAGRPASRHGLAVVVGCQRLVGPHSSRW